MLTNLAKKCAIKFQTPLYLYQAEVIQTQYENLKKITHDEADIFYSLKANPNLAIAQLLRSYGANAEVCSLAELAIALEAGFSPENIIFVGPVKSDEEIHYALDNHIYAIVCESINEIQRINHVAQKKKMIAPIFLRINPDFCVEKAPLKMGGVSSQFGMDIKNLPKNSPVKNCSSVKLKGIHVYNGTRILDEKSIAENMKKIFNLATKLSRDWHIEFESLDLGGGFGVAYFDNEKPLDVSYLTDLIAPLFRQFKQVHPRTRLIIESGRYLVADSGVFICRVCDVKQSQGENFLVTDGGMNCHMAATGIGALLKRNFPIVSLANLEEPSVCYNITGPLCTPGDLIGREIMLPSMNIGDYIAILMAGAYGPSASPIRFLSHGHPAEVLLLNNKAHLIRKKDSVNDMIQNFIKLKGEQLCNEKN